MKKIKKSSSVLGNFSAIYSAAMRSDDGNRCMIAPHPKLKKKIKQELKKLKLKSVKTALVNKIKIGDESRAGFNDGLLVHGSDFPLGTSLQLARASKLEKTPLRGTLRVAVVLVDFSDKKMNVSKKSFEDLFFSTGKITTGSVKEYYREVTNNLIDIEGEVVGPLRMPRKLSAYAHGASGTGNTSPNARTLAKDAAVAAASLINFGSYDNDGD
ncbi:MAG: immune inhibitor A domain-containing protein, partial [Flammeovirgaceae bacterium]